MHIKTVYITMLLLMIAHYTPAQQKRSKDFGVTDKAIHKSANSNYIYNILKQQLSKGNNLHYLETSTNADDLNAIMLITDSLLTAKGYKKSSEIEFKQKVKNIFGFTDQQCKNDVLSFYIGGYSDSKCVPFNSGDEYYFGNQGVVFSISFKLQLITTMFSIPQLLEYKTKYPELEELEKKLSNKVKLDNGSVEDFVKWKDVVGLDSSCKQNAQFLIALNSYFFNNNKAYVPYLQFNYPQLIQALIQDYGYTKEPSFNKFILEKYAKKAIDFSKPNYNNYLKIFGEAIFTHDCKKHLVISKNLLNYIAQYADSVSGKEMMSALFYFAVEAMDDRWLLSEKRKIKAYAASTFDEYFFGKVYANKETNLVGDIYIPIMGMTLKYDKQAEAEYIKNDYYGLSNLREIINKTKREWLDDFQYKRPFYPKP